MKQMHAIQRAFGVTIVLAGLLVMASRPAVAGMGRDRDPIDQLLKRDQLKEAVAGLEALKPKYAKESELHALLGECQWRLGQLPAARASFETAKQLDDKSAHAYAGLALVALSGDRVEEADALARQALERDHNLWLANYAMGRVLLAQGSLDKAFSHFEKGEKLKSREDGRDLFEAGLGLLSLAEKTAESASSAETHLIKARALAGNTVEHVMNLTDMYEATNQWGQASTLLAGMVEQVGPSPQLLFRLGRAYENQRRYNEAFEQYQKAVAADSSFAPGRASLGHLLMMDTRRTAQAVPHLIAAEKIKESPQVLLDLGIALTRLGRQEEAVPRLQKYLEFENTPLARARLAAALVGTDDWAKGIDMFEKDVELRNEAQAEDLVAVGVRFISEQRYPDAKRYLNLALEKAPDDVEATYRLGIVDVHEKNYAAGIEKIRKKVTTAPNAAAWQNLAIAQQGLQQYDDAIESYRKVVELAPEAATAWVRLATVYSIRQRNDEALQAYSKALGLAPSNIEALRGRGYTNLLTGRYPQAIADLRPATQAEPGHADSWLWLGQALLGAGEVDQARAALEKAIELAPDNEPAHEALDAINRRG
jgi:tetratricopeptide (TPR) repeat protein